MEIMLSSLNNTTVMSIWLDASNHYDPARGVSPGSYSRLLTTYVLHAGDACVSYNTSKEATGTFKQVIFTAIHLIENYIDS